MTTEEECPRMHCVDKVRTLLEECLGPPNETAFLNFDRYLENELALSVEELPDPTISFQSFLDRISTFRPQYWGADPNAILQFAKYGWRCSDKFTIMCDVCLSTVECSSLIQKPELWTLVSYKGHEKLCFWTGCPCPDRFTKITINPKIIKKKMALCLKRTGDVGSDLPSISKEVLASMDITDETLDALFEILDSQQTEETVSALLLAICGWLNGEVDRTMKCGYCQRQILFHNFVSIKDMSEKQSVSELERSASGDDADRMEVCDDDRAGVAESGKNVDEDKGGDVNPSTQGEVNNSVITTSPTAVDEVESTVLPKLDAACTVGEIRDVANSTVGNDSESETVTDCGKESSEELGNATPEAASDGKPPATMKGEDQCNLHLEAKINEVAEEPGRMFNGGVSDDGEVGHQGVADVQSSKKRKLEDEESTPEAENLCADDQLNAKKVCLAVEENGECREVEEVAGKKDSSLSLFNNCHGGSVNEKSAVCKTEAGKVGPEQPCKNVTAVDGSCKENEVTDEKMQISESHSPVKSLNSDYSNSAGVTEETPTVTKSDTVAAMKLNGDAPAALVSDSVQVPKLNSLKDADVASACETEGGCSGVVQSGASEELGEEANLKPPQCEGKPDVVNHTIATPDCEDGGGNSVGVCAAAGLTDDGEPADCEMVADGGDGCDRIENGGRESCETETETPGTSKKKSGKRKLEDCADNDVEESLKRKREEPAVAPLPPPPPRKQFHPVEEHRYWCIWKLRTKDRGVQKEGWRQVMDYLKLSPPTPAEQPTPDFYGEVKKLFTLLGDW